MIFGGSPRSHSDRQRTACYASRKPAPKVVPIYPCLDVATYPSLHLGCGGIYQATAMVAFTCLPPIKHVTEELRHAYKSTRQCIASRRSHRLPDSSDRSTRNCFADQVQKRALRENDQARGSCGWIQHAWCLALAA